MYKKIIGYEFSYFLRNKSMLIFTLTLLLVTGYALLNGNTYYKKQITIIHQLKEKDNVAFATIAGNFGIDTLIEKNKRIYKNVIKASWAIFDNRFNVYWKPSPISVICIGNRDLYPYYQEILPISLYMRLFKNEIANPNVLLIGNIDFSYVIIFLVPLFIISLLFNFLSEDKERGIQSFLHTNCSSVKQIILARLLFYILIIFSIITILFAFAVFFVADKRQMGCLYGLSLLYGLFWIIVSYLINLLDRSSVFNVSFLVSIWLIFSLLIPSFSNQIASVKYPINIEEISKMMRRVQLSDDDKDLQTVLEKFYGKYPHYSHPDTTATNLFSRAYVVQGQLSDLEGDLLLNGICNSMLQKQQFLKNIAYVNPVMYLQGKFADEAATNLTDYVDYLKKIQQFNIKLKAFYFKKIFTNDKMNIEYYKTIPKWE